MTKHPRRKPAPKHIHHKPAPKKHKNYHAGIWIIILIALIAAIPFAIGKYIEINSPGAFDSGAYIYSAKHVLSGAQIGTDEIPSARVATLLMNIAAVAIFGYQDHATVLIQGICQLAALILMFIATQRIFGRLPAALAVIIAATFLSSPLVAKFGNVKEQYMVAFMVLGISSLIIRQTGGKWIWAILTGAFLSWAPLFKETGVSAIIAAAVFLIAQPIFKHRTIKETITEIALIIAGAAAALAPLYIWLAAHGAPVTYWPYHFVFRILLPEKGAQVGGAYIGSARTMLDFKTQAAKVFRFYSLLILPIALALVAIIARLTRAVMSRTKHTPATQPFDRFVLLLAVWWILDMAFIWISPRSYEQYYLPLNASAAMLAGYIAALYAKKLYQTHFDPKWLVTGLLSLLLMILMSLHIVTGTEVSPHSGQKYGEGKRRFGFVQGIESANFYRQGAVGQWQQAGDFIRQNSTEQDRIYVWGWFPGIYVRAQRLCPAPRACTSEMHVMSPQKLAQYVDELLKSFKNNPPKFIVDTHKTHFPWNRPPLELWPTTQQGFLPNDPQAIKTYEESYELALTQRVAPDEAERFNAMKPLRDYVMQNYKVARVFGNQVVFQRINSN